MFKACTLPQQPMLQSYLDSSNAFYLDLLGYKQEQTKLNVLDYEQWQALCKKQEGNQDASGMFQPRSQIAVINSENDAYPLNLFHEYFGHGLFYERTLAGKRLVDLEQKLMQEEKEHFEGIPFSLKELKRFRENNATFKHMQQEREENLDLYENFAIWTEYLLAKHFGINQFEMRYDSMPESERSQFDKILAFSKRYGNLSTFYAVGFERKITIPRVKMLLEDVYRNLLQDARLVVVYGSRKPFSDIDIFAVSDNLPEIDTNWLDVRVCSVKDFEEGVKLFDITITDPLLTGEIIYGDKDYLEQQKTRLVRQPITEEAIKYNIKQSERQERMALEFSVGSNENFRGMSYSLTYLRNAFALREGKRLLTKSRMSANTLLSEGETKQCRGTK